MKIVHVGWCKEDNHDKVWGIILLQEDTRYPFINKCVTFWGRRGGKLQTKIFEDSLYKINNMFRKKLAKGYQEIDKSQLDNVYPEFESDLKKTAVWSMLKL
jgi:hypothetical protein